MAKDKLKNTKRRSDGSLPRGVIATAKLNRNEQKWDREVVRNDLSDYEYLEGLVKLNEHLINVITEHKQALGI